MALQHLANTLVHGWTSVDLTAQLERWGTMGGPPADVTRADPLYFAEFYDLLVEVRGVLAQREVDSARDAVDRDVTHAHRLAARIRKALDAASAAYDDAVAAARQASADANARAAELQAAEKHLAAAEQRERELLVGLPDGFTEDEVREEAEAARQAATHAAEAAEAAAEVAAQQTQAAQLRREARLRALAANSTATAAMKEADGTVEGMSMPSVTPTTAQRLAAIAADVKSIVADALLRL